MWETARSMSIPPVSVLIKNEWMAESILPFVELLPSSTSAIYENDPRQIISVLREATNLSVRLSLLPDLIEVRKSMGDAIFPFCRELSQQSYPLLHFVAPQLYVWLHNTFRFLVSKEYAFQLTMSELINKQRLQERFDSARVHHTLALWDRARIGLNRLLLETDRKVHWECEEVSIPFDTLEDTKLVFLLSEGSHPTDGNDFLFLIINEIVTAYNSFSKKLAAFYSSKDVYNANTTMLQPRFIIRGYGGAAKIGSVVPLSTDDLTWVAECCWNSESCTYETEKMKCMLQDMVNLHDKPVILSNPLDHLREKFCFRDDAVLSFDEFNRNITITANKDGNFFANHQDAQLVDEVHQLLNTLRMEIGDGQIRRTLIDNFHGLDYDRRGQCWKAVVVSSICC